MTEKKKAGRPPKEIDWKMFESLCAIQCTQDEIANIMRVDSETLRKHARLEYKENDYSLIHKKLSDCGKVSLRRNQYNLSKKNASVAIWLGKQWLGQKDEQAQDVASEHIDKFNNLMSQLLSLQSNRNLVDNNQSKETKS